MRACAVFLVLAACGHAATIQDVGDDFQQIDAAVDTCNPVAQIGCDPGLKCSWTRTMATPAKQQGVIACVPDGTVALGAPCEYGAAGPSTGYDSCARGLACVAPIDQDMSSGTCAAICDVTAAAGAPGSCAAGFTCTLQTGYFANAGDPPQEVGLCDAT